MRWVGWVEPFGPKNEPVYMTVSEEVAIAWTKAAALAHSGYTYENDERALDSFMAIHWADFVNDPTKELANDYTL